MYILSSRERERERETERDRERERVAQWHTDTYKCAAHNYLLVAYSVTASSFERCPCFTGWLDYIPCVWLGKTVRDPIVDYYWRGADSCVLRQHTTRRSRMRQFPHSKINTLSLSARQPN
jgi:hypothetical protein